MAKLNTSTVFDLEFFFEITPDLICIAGFDGYFKKINPAVSKTLGYTYDELLSAPINSFIFPGDQEITSQRHLGLTQGHSLLNFENRYVSKEGFIIWLSWTSVPIVRDRLIFGIAKNITYRKQLEEYDRISSIMGMINDDYQKRFKSEGSGSGPDRLAPSAIGIRRVNEEHSQSDQFWLNNFEMSVRKHVGRLDLNLNLLSGDLAISQRQLFRQVKRILGITPNKLMRVIRLQLAWEAIASGKYRTIKEISNIAGYSSRSHFTKLFKEVYGINASELL